MKLVIDRSKWLRGEGGRTSWLLRPGDGKMCCLGFYACLLGAEVGHISGLSHPETATAVPWPEWLATGEMNVDRCNVIATNDSREILDVHREPRIAEIFAKHGVEVEFIDGTPLADSEVPVGGGS